MAGLTPREFVGRWRGVALKERSASQPHFIDLCGLLDQPTPTEADPTGEFYTFERGAKKNAATGGQATRLNNDVSRLLSRFAGEIAPVRVLDPACGSGNALGVSLKQLLNLEKEVIASITPPFYQS